MKLVLSNTNTKVEDASLEERTWLLDYLVFKERKYNPWQKRFEEKVTKFYNDVSGQFPAGYTRTVMEVGRQLGYTVTVVDARVKPCAPNPAADLEWLNHHPAANVDPIAHQMEAVRAVHARTRGIVKVPTGGGKTEIAIGLVKSLPCTWLFMVHRGDLLKQTAARFELRCPGETAGMIGDGEWKVERFTVATFQTLHAKLKAHDPDTLKLLANVQGIICDEVHTLAADTFWAVAMKTTKAYYRVGLSATPLKHGSNRGTFVIAALGPVIYTVSAKLLQSLGVLSRPTIKFVTVKQTATLPTWQGVYGENIVRSAKRNRAIIEIVEQAAKPCLVFVKQLNHGVLLHKALLKAGLACENISGKETVPQRTAAVERLIRGDNDVLVVNVIFQEGVDIPSLASVVMANGDASPIAVLQRMGRGMRATKVKSTFEVYDIADRGCGCTQATRRKDPKNFHKGCQWLDSHTKDRLKALEEEEYDVEITDPDTLWSQAK